MPPPPIPICACCAPCFNLSMKPMASPLSWDETSLTRDSRLEAAEGRRADYDLVAVLQPDPRLASAADPGGGAGGDDIARLEGHQRGEVRHQLGDREDQVVGRGRLHRLAVQLECELDPVVRPGL